MAIEDALVAILPLQGGAPAGGGLLVDRNLVLTCAHVVNLALNRLPLQTGRPQKAEKVMVRLHFAPSQRLTAQVESGDDAWSDPPATRQFGADLCLLRLDSAPEGEIKPGEMRVFANLAERKFRAAGFPKDWDVDFATGEVVGRDQHRLWMLRPELGTLVSTQTKGTLLGGEQRPPGVIYEGFSGSPVEVDGRIAGLLTEARLHISEVTAYMVPVADFPARVRALAEIEREGVPREQGVAIEAPPDAPWNVPSPWNTFFTAREQVLEDVGRELRSSGVVALTGFGGVGKTQTAIEYAEKHRDEYRAVLWSSADSREALVSGFAAIAELLDLPESKLRDQALAVDAVKRWLNRKPQWLLILDNANDLAVVVAFMPRNRKGHVLLTTQMHATGSVAQRVEVSQMDEQDGALLLLRRAGILAKREKLSDAQEADREVAQKIARELGGLPLALDQAGAYLEETGCGLKGYLDLYQQRSAELLREQRGPGLEHASVDGTFGLSFENVQRVNRPAAALLCLCAYLEPDAIPEEIFSQGADELGPILQPVAADPALLNQAIEATSKYSLLRRDANAKTLSIHRLVQTVIKNRLNPAEQRQWAERAVNAVSRAFPYIELSRWPECERILPHARACRALIDQWNFETPEAARVLNQLGFYLSERSRFQDVEPILERALEIRGKLSAPEQLQTLNNLAGYFRAQRKYNRAALLYQKALAMLGEPETVQPPTEAASKKEDALRPESATPSPQPIYPRWQEPWDSRLGSEHPDLAWILNNLAEVYRDLGKYTQAEPLYQRALEIRGKAQQGEHASTASILSNLAQLYASQGRHSDAERLHRQALQIRRSNLKEEGPNVALSLLNLAELYRVQGKFGEAEALFKKAKQTFEAAVGPDHTDLAATLNNLALLFGEQGKYAEAEPLYRQAQEILEKSLGPNDPDVATVLANYAILLRRTHRESEASALEARAHRIHSEHGTQESKR